MSIGYVFASMVDLVFLVSGIFLLEYTIVLLLRRKLKYVLSWPLLAVAIGWLLAAVWELYCQGQGYSIRLDVFFIYPILIIASLLGLFVTIGSMIRGLYKQRR